MRETKINTELKASRKFPDQFLWGVATSHFQIEGNRAEMESRLSDWSAWMSEPGRIIDGSNAEMACQFLSNFAQDLDLVQEMNLNSFRFSFNWPALLAEGSNGAEKPLKLNPKAKEFYLSMLEELKSRKIKTFATIFHFCLPSRLQEAGGWTSEKTVREMEEFTALIAEEFGEYIDYWLTINEPMAYVYQSYVSGLWTPGHVNDYLGAFQVVRNMMLAHAGAYRILKEKCPDAPVSFTNHWRPFHAESWLNPLDHAVCKIRNDVFNHLFPRGIKSGAFELPLPLRLHGELRRLEGEIEGLRDSIDYVGVNYYTRDISRFKPGLPLDLFGVTSTKKRKVTNSLGWEIFPRGLYDVLTKDLRPYLTDSLGNELDVIITENGFAQSFEEALSEGDWSLDDEERVSYLLTHLDELHRAIKDGIKVKGYLHWSLLDNFEWAEGLAPRFGLVRVAYPSQERTLRKSAGIYSRIAELNAIPDDLI